MGITHQNDIVDNGCDECQHRQKCRDLETCFLLSFDHHHIGMEQEEQ